MDAATAKKFVEENIRYDQVKALLVKLLRFPSPQTELLEAEPQVRALIREVIRFELEEAGVIMTSSLSQKSTTRPKSSPSWHCTGDGLGNDLITPPRAATEADRWSGNPAAPRSHPARWLLTGRMTTTKIYYLQSKMRDY
jgi:hypothetical protein